MAVSWGYTMVLVMTIVALLTFSQPLFQLAIPESVEEHAQTDVDIVSKDAVPPGHHPLTSKASEAWISENIVLLCGSRRQRRTRKVLIHRRRPAPCRDDINFPDSARGKNIPLQQSKRKTSPAQQQSQSAPALKVLRRSVLATFQSDRMVPTGPNPLHNSNRSQVIFP